MSAQQRLMFDEQPEQVTHQDFGIVGLRYIPNFIDRQKHDELLRKIDDEPWLNDLKRRVQHYGYKYNYKSRSVDQSMRIGPLPSWADELGTMLVKQELMSEMPDQVIVNEYLPGQGIANHIDCVPCFSDTVISLSLGSPCLMELTNRESMRVVPILLEPCSIVVLQKDARFVWTHGIPARKTDRFHERLINRRRRVSLTFRKMILKSDDTTKKGSQMSTDEDDDLPLQPGDARLIYDCIIHAIKTNSGHGFHNHDQGHLIYQAGAKGINDKQAFGEVSDDNELFALLNKLAHLINKDRGTGVKVFRWEEFCQIAVDATKRQ